MREAPDGMCAQLPAALYRRPKPMSRARNLLPAPHRDCLPQKTRIRPAAAAAPLVRPHHPRGPNIRMRNMFPMHLSRVSFSGVELTSLSAPDSFPKRALLCNTTWLQQLPALIGQPAAHGS
jgi:hypothetical protein